MAASAAGRIDSMVTVMGMVSRMAEASA